VANDVSDTTAVSETKRFFIWGAFYLYCNMKELTRLGLTQQLHSSDDTSSSRDGDGVEDDVNDDETSPSEGGVGLIRVWIWSLNLVLFVFLATS
jgi:hypothetical protein